MYFVFKTPTSSLTRHLCASGHMTNGEEEGGLINEIKCKRKLGLGTLKWIEVPHLGWTLDPGYSPLLALTA